MAKNIIKEIIIILLLAIVIILILGIMLYEYIPANKIIPEKVSYSTPGSIQEELKKSEDIENDESVITYQLDSTDLNNFQKINEYVPGKKNPFSSVSNEVNENGNGNTSSENNNSSSGTTNSNSSSSGYLPNKGTK